VSAEAKADSVALAASGDAPREARPRASVRNAFACRIRSEHHPAVDDAFPVLLGDDVEQRQRAPDVSGFLRAGRSGGADRRHSSAAAATPAAKAPDKMRGRAMPDFETHFQLGVKAVLDDRAALGFG
jgi:hypothetical protein